MALALREIARRPAQDPATAAAAGRMLGDARAGDRGPAPGRRRARPAALPGRPARAPRRGGRAPAAALAAGAAAKAVAEGPAVVIGVRRRCWAAASRCAVDAPRGAARGTPARAAVPLAAGAPGDARLRVAVVVPQFRRGSRAATRRSCTCCGRSRPAARRARSGSRTRGAAGSASLAWFGAPGRGVHAGFEGWEGADVVLATGWQTVHRVLRLPGARARAYLVQDHEPEFYGTSAERTWAQETYAPRAAVHRRDAVAGRAAARPLRRDRADAFDLGIDHAVYRPEPGVERRADTRRALRTGGHAAPRGAARPAGARELRRRRPRGRARAVRRGAGAGRPLPGASTRRARACGARAPVLGGRRRRRAVADQPLAGADRDDGLRAAGRRRRQRRRPARRSATTGRWRCRRPTRWRWRPPSTGCSAIPASGRGGPAPASSWRPGAPGSAPRSRSRRR